MSVFKSIEAAITPSRRSLDPSPSTSSSAATSTSTSATATATATSGAAASHPPSHPPSHALPKHPTNKKPYPHSPPGKLPTPQGDVIALTYDALDAQRATRGLSSPWAGAAVVFCGMTRDDHRPATATATATEGSGSGSVNGDGAPPTMLGVARLEYEAYTPLALKTLRAIVWRARTTPAGEWPPRSLRPSDVSALDADVSSHLRSGLRGSGGAPSGSASASSSSSSSSSPSSSRDAGHAPPPPDALIRIALIHRLGPVPLCEASVLVGVSTPHRARAFAVAEWLLEEVKRCVPVWKREVRVRLPPPPPPPQRLAGQEEEAEGEQEGDAERRGKASGAKGGKAGKSGANGHAHRHGSAKRLSGVKGAGTSRKDEVPEDGSGWINLDLNLEPKVGKENGTSASASQGSQSRT